MGIFTTGSGTTSIDIYSPVQEDFNVEGRNVNFHVLATEAVVESNRFYNNTMKGVGIAELRYFEEHGTEVVYEAGDMSSFFEKIKMFFKKLIDKVKSIFHAFIAKLSSFVKSDKDFAKKYEKEFTEKWSKVNDNFGFKGYKFQNLSNLDEKVYSMDNSKWSTILTTNGWIMDDVNSIKHTTSDTTDEKKYNDPTKYIKDNREKIQDTLRATVIKNHYASYAKSTVDSGDFAKELFELFHGSSEKETIDKKDVASGSSLTIVNELKTASETKKAAEKASKYLIKAIDDNIKAIEDIQKTVRDDFSKDNDAVNKAQAALLSYLTEITSLYRNHKEYCTQANGAYLQALADRSRQWKAVMTKVIAGGKKMNESYEGYSESASYGSGSFLDSVVIK